MPFSVVEFYDKRSSYQCGYCKQSDSCHSYGMWAYKLSCEDYQDLIDRGWRRSGCYCYKPIMDVTCCPSYTIKCDALNFRLNKSHKKIIKRMNKFLRDGKRESDEEENPQSFGEIGTLSHEHIETPRMPTKPIDLEYLEPTMDIAKQTTETIKARSKDLSEKGAEALKPSHGMGNPTVSDVPKKAKLMRIIRKRDKLQKKGLTGEELERSMLAGKGHNKEKSLEDFLYEFPKENEPSAHRLTVKFIQSKDCAIPTTFKLYSSYQQSIHKEPSSKLSMERFKRFLINSPLKIVTLPTGGKKFQESLDISYALYVKYQTSIHSDPPGSVADYLDFLVKSPLKGSADFGSFHQQYWLDDRLIAVGVIDVLPLCVSSVYFFYDPEYRFLSLGTYGSLREIAFTRARYRVNPSITSYYMGFYIHSCPKMRYKSSLQPSRLLCPEAYTWHLLDKNILSKLDARKYNRLNEDKLVQDAQKPTEQDLQDVLLLVGRSYLRYSEYSLVAQVVPDVSTYAQLVGKVCAKRMMLYGV
ncbi:arginyl-tRNA--protein transferase 1 isoform X1 [Anopheles ziemanni]|uniref:arginyl-tRNA--protein transferase 1 isoform X1 n=1 Tax=Anopheles coustani TaxID=139045 RepID=UPI002659B783|nr:arginyl-tRNA--protein transferase 1 isoform X1 [Anopheles coustani]XP_058176914.1 arginyl-tRNA--protein transferase 1 isoform X1 [Anopheles ziemanni]